MWGWWILIYIAFAELIYKFHRLTLVEFGRFRMEFAPPKKDEADRSRKPRQLRSHNGKKQLKK